MNKFSPESTVCKHCAFYINENSVHGCSLNKIGHYNKLGVVVVGSVDTILLKDFICPYLRNPTWPQINNIQTKEEALSLIKKENQLPYLPIILFPKKEEIGPILRKLLRFNVPPKKFHIVLEASRANELQDVVKLCEATKLKWHISFSLEDKSWHDIFRIYNRPEFLMLITEYPHIDNDWSEKLTEKIQDELFKFSYAENKSQTVTVISPYIYNSYYFDYTKDWLEKLKEERYGQKYIL